VLICKFISIFQNGDTALHIAAALKRRKLTKLLVEAGIKTNLKNKVVVVCSGISQQTAAVL